MDGLGTQVVQADAILEMREAGSTGSDIITALVKGSSTFQQKTQFAQEKYLKKKQAR